ncbi:ABC transporter permease [Phycicoccus sp. CSK15P-2]|uniref:ABC transporter permease n=1 Tax=Phycicoccus sp. CSK15P-2 TaxID=2807627 RepID=UPI0019510382|nr:ABC transporter permease [Phycicoccus sp. CSK15P-2]MBM6403409.1 ABC transporter permease [Phycicoccus sp. CSK15P-2]
MTTTTRPVRTDAPATTPEAATAPWLLVARREIVVRLTDKAFLFGTLFTILLICGFTGWQVYDASRTSEYTVTATPGDREMADRVAAEAPEDTVAVDVEPAADDAAARSLVLAGDADAWLHLGEDGWVLTTEDSENAGLTRVTQDVVRTAVLERQAEALGTTTAELEAGSEVSTSLLRGDARQSRLAEFVGFAFGFLFYIAALSFGYVIANSVVEEKQSRVVEIITTSIPVRHLLAGKIVGNSLIAILQMVLYAGIGLVGIALTEYSGLVTVVTGPVAWYLVFFVAGFAALAALWAAAGALASRTEDIQSTTAPLLMLVLAVFFAAMLVEGTARTVLSFVPPFSAVLMPTRLLEGGAAWWEAVVALVLLMATAVAIVGVAQRLYRRSLLQTGGRLSLRQAWSAPE